MLVIALARADGGGDALVLHDPGVFLRTRAVVTPALPVTDGERACTYSLLLVGGELQPSVRSCPTAHVPVLEPVLRSWMEGVDLRVEPEARGDTRELLRITAISPTPSDPSSGVFVWPVHEDTLRLELPAVLTRLWRERECRDEAEVRSWGGSPGDPPPCRVVIHFDRFGRPSLGEVAGCPDGAAEGLLAAQRTCAMQTDGVPAGYATSVMLDSRGPRPEPDGILLRSGFELE